MDHCVCMLSCFNCVQLFAIPWTVACQAPLSRQEYWSGLPCPSGDLPKGTAPESLTSPAGHRNSHNLLPERSTLTEKSNSSLALVYLTRSIYLVNFNLNLILTLTMHKTCFSGFISTIFLQFLYLYQPVPCIFSSK